MDSIRIYEEEFYAHWKYENYFPVEGIVIDAILDEELSKIVLSCGNRLLTVQGNLPMNFAYSGANLILLCQKCSLVFAFLSILKFQNYERNFLIFR